MSLDKNEPGAAAPRPKLPYVVAVLAGLLVIGLAVWLVVGRRQAGPASGNGSAAAPAAPGPVTTPGRVQTLPSGLRIETLSEGSGPLVTRADAVLVRYELRGPRGDVIDSNMEAPQGAGMTLNLVVPGFAEGLTHMRQGGVARLWVPPHLAYGASVPPGAPFGPTDTLIFLIRVDQVAPGEAAAWEAAQRGTPPPSR